MLSFFAEELRAGEVRVTPYLLTSVIYTDNLEYSATDKIAAQGLDIAPGIRIESDGRRVDLRLDYSARSIRYDVGNRSFYHTVNAFGKAEIVRGLFFIETDGSLTRRPVRGGSDALQQYNLGLGGTDVVRYGVSPYLSWSSPGKDVVSTLRYRFDSVAYDQEGITDATSNRVLFDVSNEAAGQQFRWQASYLWRQAGFGTGSEATFESATVNVVIPIAFQLGFLFDGGYERNEYQTDALLSAPEGSFWLVGLRWKPRQNFYLQATSGQRFFGSSYAFNLMYESANTLWTLSYIERVSTYLETLLKAGGQSKPSSLLDQLYLPDAELNEETSIIKSWQGQLMIGKRNRVLTLNVFNRDRQSQLNLSLEDRSYGGSGRLDLNLSSSGSLALGLLAARVENMVSDDSGDLMSGGVEYRHVFSRYVQGLVTYRHSREDSTVNEDVFAENMIRFSLLFRHADGANGEGMGMGTDLFRKTPQKRPRAE